MKSAQQITCSLIVSIALVGCLVNAAAAADPLPSWNNTHARQAILAFVKKVTTKGSPSYVPPRKRIATFDNDGTLWAEKPYYFQAAFAIDIAKARAASDPSVASQEPFKTLTLEGPAGLAAKGQRAILQLVMATHAGITAQAFDQAVRQWLATAVHPTLKRRYITLVYQPQLELLNYLRANGFKTFIVSGGGVDFMRVFAEETYGIPPEQVVGSSIKVKYEMRDGVPTLIKLPKVNLIDDHAGKPVGIYQYIGRRPILAFGNSDGDLQMLEYTTIPRGPDDHTPRLGLILHHDDANREFAYDRHSPIGKLDKALDAAPKYGWIVVSMKDDWKAVFPSAGDGK